MENKPDWNDAPEWADRIVFSAFSGNYFFGDGRRVLNRGHKITLAHDDIELVEMRPKQNPADKAYDELPPGELDISPAITEQNRKLGKSIPSDVIEHDNKNKYSRKIKTVVIDGIDHDIYVDVYDVLNAFKVVNPAMAHAIKKMLASGQRGAKGVIQDMQEAIQSIGRAIELEK